MIGAGCAGAALALFILWQLCRRVVRAGFFLLAFVVFFGLCAGALWVARGQPDWAAAAGAALVLAALWSSVRARVARWATLLAVLLFAAAAWQLDWRGFLTPVSAQKGTGKGSSGGESARTKAAESESPLAR